MKKGLAALVAAAILFAMLLLSDVTWRAAHEDAAELRVSWRLTAPTSESCRPPTEEEIASLPAHMRPQEICSGGAVPFFLRVVLDGDTLRSGPADPAMGRSDRTVSVFETYPIDAGSHEVDVAIWPDSSVADLPPGLERRLTTRLEVEGREVVLVTLGEGADLVVRRSE